MTSFKKEKVIISVYKKNSQYGHLEINKRNEVKRFIEKPPHPLPINIGFYMINYKIINRFHKNNYELEIDFLPRLVKKNLLISFEHKGYFYSINDNNMINLPLKSVNNIDVFHV